MITASKSAWFEQIFSLYNRSLFWRRFKHLRVAGTENLRARDIQIPLVLYANHSSWWDPLIVHAINRNTKLDAYAMMEEKNLRKLRFFRKIGAFSVVRENPREAVKSIRYAVSLLKTKQNRAVWIFPQGEILPNDRRPLNFYHGLARVIEQTNGCYAAPVAMRYEFLEDFKPEAFARIGQLEFFGKIANSKILTVDLMRKLTLTLDRIKVDILEMNFNDYEIW